MALQRLEFQPGIQKNVTRYGSGGAWWHADKVRFRGGFPEKIGGWQRHGAGLQFEGVCRSLFPWSTLGGLPMVGVGTGRRFYVITGGVDREVTPYRREVDRTDPFETTNGSSTVTVTDNDHGARKDDIVEFSGASSVGGLTLDGEYTIENVVDSATYEIDAGEDATSSGTGGGTVTLGYILHAGIGEWVPSAGWSAGPYGFDEYGALETTLEPEDRLGLWTQDNWGEDLVICARDWGIFRYDASNLTDRAVALSDLSGASDTPEAAIMVMVSHRDRHAIAFGATPVGSSTQDRMLVRWCDQEDLANWTPSDTTTAGSLRLDHGSEIITARQTRNEILIWTDTALYGMGYVGPPYIFGVELLGQGIDIAGINAAVVHNDVAFWMGHGGFYAFMGQIESLPCPVQDYVLTRVDWSQADKIFAGINRAFTEIMWLYPSTDGDGECDSYVCFNIAEKAWTYGSLDRTAWVDTGLSRYPIAAGTDGYLYYHESGFDDGSDDSGIEAFIESGPIEIGSGEQIVFLRRIIHDVTFRNDESDNGTVNIELIASDFPGEEDHKDVDEDVTRTATVPVEQFTRESFLRLRGRSFRLRVSSDSKGTAWRLGVPRVDIRPDGKR